MKIIKTVHEMRQYIKEEGANGHSVGLVPTMGYLHEGHASLIARSAEENDVTVVSVFVNPTQFGANEDLDSYPRDLEHDCAVAEQAGAQVIFHPTAAEMYPSGYRTYVNVEEITLPLCGKSRPTHFRGVTTVVCKLFCIVTPDRAYFGQKDAQQLIVIKQMVRDLNMGVKIVPCPIVRETDGLAKSSRNVYLNEEERRQALVLSQALTMARNLYENGEENAENLRQAMIEKIQSAPLAKIDYVELVDLESLQKVQTVGQPTLAALAVRFGTTRLIDNTILGEEIS